MFSHLNNNKQVLNMLSDILFGYLSKLFMPSNTESPKNKRLLSKYP